MLLLIRVELYRVSQKRSFVFAVSKYDVKYGIKKRFFGTPDILNFQTEEIINNGLFTVSFFSTEVRPFSNGHAQKVRTFGVTTNDPKGTFFLRHPIHSLNLFTVTRNDPKKRYLGHPIHTLNLFFRTHHFGSSLSHVEI